MKKYIRTTYFITKDKETQIHSDKNIKPDTAELR